MSEEEWKTIEYPQFRMSEYSPKAWKYVSSWGRLKSGDGRIIEATPGKGYCRTSLSIHVEGAYAGLAMVPLHRIVAYTFLGEPPTPLHTVDHINRVREDNRVENLQWASPQEQLANREFSQYVIKVIVENQSQQQQIFESLKALSKEHGIKVSVLSSLLRHAQPGDEFHIQGVRLQVENVSRKSMSTDDSVTIKNYGAGYQKQGRSSRKHVALSMYIDGTSVQQISREMQIKEPTVLQYLGQAARESPADVLGPLAERMHMTCRETRSRFAQDLAEFHQHFQHVQGNYETQYRAIVAKHFPEMHNDWPVVKETFRAIHKMLE